MSWALWTILGIAIGAAVAQVIIRVGTPRIGRLTVTEGLTKDTFRFDFDCDTADIKNYKHGTIAIVLDRPAGKRLDDPEDDSVAEQLARDLETARKRQKQLEK